MATPISLLIKTCGLTITEASQFANVSSAAMRSWVYGHRNPPETVMTQLRDLYDLQRAYADQIMEEVKRLASSPKAPDVYRLGLAQNDESANALGWPCVNAQAHALGIVIACIDGYFKICPMDHPKL